MENRPKPPGSLLIRNPGGNAGPAHHEGHQGVLPIGLLVARCAVLEDLLAVIGGDNDERVVFKAQLAEL